MIHSLLNDGSFAVRPRLASTPSVGRRVVITGVPRSGKSHLAARLGGEPGVIHRSTDDLIGQFDWSALSAEVVGWFGAPGPWVYDGVRIPHAIRKFFVANSEGLPADIFVWLTVPFVELTKGQRTMAAGIETVWSQVEPELRRRGAKIFNDTSGEYR